MCLGRPKDLKKDQTPGPGNYNTPSYFNSMGFLIKLKVNIHYQQLKIVEFQYLILQVLKDF